MQIDYPSAFKMPAAEAARRCGWQLRNRSGRVFVRPQEAFEKSLPGLLRLEPLTGEGGAPQLDGQRGSRLSDIGDELASLAPRLREMARQATTTEAFLGFSGNLLSVTPDSEAPAEIDAIQARMVAEVPNSTIWAVPTHARLAMRVSLINGLFTQAETPELFASLEDVVGFESGRGFLGPLIYGQSLFLKPYLLATSPHVLGWSADRLGGALVVLFGQPVLHFGDQRPSPTMLDLNAPHGWPSWDRPPSETKPSVSVAATQHALRWWVRQIDVLLGQLLDPRSYRNAEGRHDPAQQIAMMLTTLRLFISVQALLSEPTQSPLRLSLLFDVLDLLEGMRMGGYDATLSHQRLEREATVLREALPADVAAVLMPKCDGGVDAIARVADGFFCTDRLTPTGFRVPSKQGETEIKLDRASSHYLRLVRNSTHSFSSMAKVRDRDLVLYACHTGHLDPRLPDLAFLHLLRIVANPNLVFGLARQSQRTASDTQP